MADKKTPEMPDAVRNKIADREAGFDYDLRQRLREIKAERAGIPTQVMKLLEHHETMRAEAFGTVPAPVLEKLIEAATQQLVYDDEAFRKAAQYRGIDLSSMTVIAATPPPPSAPAGSIWQPEGDEFDVDVMNQRYALVLMGGGSIIAHFSPEAEPEKRLEFIKLTGFRDIYANRYTVVRAPDGKEKHITWADAWMKHRDRRQYSGIEFHPDAANEGGTRGYLNLWQGFARGRSKTGSYSIFRDHLLTNVCHGDETLFTWLFAWFANIFQDPRNKPGTSVVLRGAMGVGKTKVGEVFGALLGPHYLIVGNPRYIIGQFNTHLASCLLLQGEEAVWAGDKLAEGSLKDLITGEHQMIEAKGVDPVRLRNYVRVLQTSNEEWVVPAGKDERRFAIFDVAPTCANDSGYFAQMDAELRSGGYERLLEDLLTFDLSNVNLRHIPKTEALLHQKIHSLDPIEAWLLDRLKAGAPSAKLHHWPKLIAVEAFREDYLRASDEASVKRRAYETQFGMKIAKLLPSIQKVRRYLDEENRPAMARSWCYQLSPLEQCRADFEHALGQAIDWGDSDDDQRAQPSITGDDIGWTENGKE
jgi:hypothetical protein